MSSEHSYRPHFPDPQLRYDAASTRFAEVVTSPPSGIVLTDAFLDVEMALFLRGKTSEESAPELLYLAAQGETVAAEKGFRETEQDMQFFQERIKDAVAIERGEYPLIEVKREHGEQHGAPDSITPIYERPDGQRVRGQSSSVREGFGINGGVIDLAPGEISGRLSPYRRLPRR